MEEHFSGKIAQKVIVVKDDAVLLVQDPRGGEDVWELPGGRLNVAEEPRAGIKREFKEEMGVEIEVGPVVHMEQFIQGSEGARAFVIVYEATLVDETLPFAVSTTEVSNVGWFTKAEVQSLQLYTEYKNALDSYFSNQ